MKLISFIVPCYNAQEYMRYCLESLLVGREDVEILIVNDGSSDNTAAIADDYARRYPECVKAIHQENKGHGGAVNTGIAHASGHYIKVVDSDDWVDVRAYVKILEHIRHMVISQRMVDLLISNFVYDKDGSTRKKTMSYESAIPVNCEFSWSEVGQFKVGQYLMMHSLMYRTDVLRRSQLQLPEHTFYVDNLFVFNPLPYVQTLYYIPVDFYRYFIGRSDQSVNEKVMIGRIAQQIKVNKLLVESYLKMPDMSKNLRAYLLNHLEITTVISSALLNKAGTADHMEMKQELWAHIEQQDPQLYRALKRGMLGRLTYGSHAVSRYTSNTIYGIAKKIFGFN